MEDEKFTLKQVLILVMLVIAVIAFLEAPAAPLWSGIFWRAFLLKVFVYGAACEVAVLAVSCFFK